MRIFNLTFLITMFLVSCGQRTVKNTSSISSVYRSVDIQNEDEENGEPDTKELRKEYVSNYNTIENIDTSFTDIEGKLIHVQTKYYCLFDNAIIVPKQYVWEDTTASFITHNYSQDIKIIIGKDTIFNKTISKVDFSDKLYTELKNYGVLMFPTFCYDKVKNIFEFGYSLTIPITDVGAGWRLLIDKKGNISKTDR